MRFSVLLILTAALPFLASADLIVNLDAPPASAATTAFVTTGSGRFSTSCSSGAGSSSDAGFTISYDGSACVGLSAEQFSLDDNGDWQGLPLIGDASGITTLTIDLGGYYSYAGGFMDYGYYFDPDAFEVLPLGNDPTVAVLDANKHILQSYDIFSLYLQESTDVNQGLFVGISSSTQNISYLQISGSQIVMSQVSVVLPEPATWTLAALALAGLPLLARRTGQVPLPVKNR